MHDFLLIRVSVKLKRSPYFHFLVVPGIDEKGSVAVAARAGSAMIARVETTGKIVPSFLISCWLPMIPRERWSL
jgi:hypothetical protein